MIGVNLSCAYDYSHYFSQSAVPASVQLGEVDSGSGSWQQKQSLLRSGPLSLTAVNQSDFGQQPFGSNTTKTFYLVNSGELAATDVKISIDSPHYSIQSDCKTIPPKMEANSNCQVTVTFSPTAFDALPANLKYSYNNSKGKAISNIIPISAVAMRWAFLKFTPTSGNVSIASSNDPQTFLLHVFYSGDLLKKVQGAQNPQDTIPPASWSGPSALQVSTRTAQLTLPQSLSFSPGSAFSFNASATAALPTGCVSPITKSCDLVLKFTPDFSGVPSNQANEGNFSGDIGIHYFNGFSANAFAETTFVAHGLSSAKIAPYAISDAAAGSVAFNPTHPGTVKVQVANPNSSTIPGTQLSIQMPTNKAFIQTASDLSATTCVNGGQIPTSGCMIQMTFSPQVSSLPSSSQSYKDSVRIGYLLGTQPETLVSTVTGTGVLPANLMFVDGSGNPVSYPSLSPFVLGLFNGTVPVYYPLSQTLTVKNTGGIGASLTLNPLVTDPNIRVSGCPGASVSANGTCQISVVFTPSDASVAHRTSFGLSYESGSTLVTPSPLAANLIGTGSLATLVVPQGGNTPQTLTQKGSTITYGASSLTTSLPAFPFGGTGGSSQAIKLLIYGLGALPNGLTAPANGNGFTFGSSNCFGKAIAAPAGQPASCSMTVSYIPPASGNAAIFPSQVANMNYTDSFGNSGSVQLTAKAIAAPNPVAHFAVQGSTSGIQSGSYQLSTTTNPILFGQTNRSLILSLWNDSSYFAVPLSGIGIVSSGSRFSIQSSSCGSTLPAFGSCSYVVQFTLQNTDNGTFTDSIQFKYQQISDGSQIGPVINGVSAVVKAMINPQPMPSPAIMNFGTVYVGNQAQATLSFTPIGYVSANPWWVGVSNLPSQVSLSSNSCTSHIGGGTPCSVVFNYSPLKLGDAIPNGMSAILTYNQSAGTQATIPISFQASLQSTSASITASGNTFAKTYFISPDPMHSVSRSGVVQLSNVSQSPSGAGATFVSASLSSPGGDFVLNPDTSDPANCVSNKALATGGGSCNVRLTFQPKSSGMASSSLSVTYFDQGLRQNVSQNIPLSGIGTVPIHIFAGGGVSCMTDETQQAVCWGDNTFGQLAQGNTSAWYQSPQQMPKINFGNNSKVTQMAVSSQHVCALLNTPSAQGVVTCWGSNEGGRLGLGLGTGGVYPSPLTSGSLNRVNLTDSKGVPKIATQIVAGYAHTCALFQDQTMQCWGAERLLSAR
jgi:hypothetical protein